MRVWLRMVLITGPPGEVAALAPAHRDHVRRLRADGKLRVAGELGDGDGFVEIFEARDRREADAVARASPLVEAGLGSLILREWTDTARD